jgi:DNA transformation protein
MPVSESFRTYVLEQIGRVVQRVRGKSMFGGVGIYSGDHFFALIDDDVLFFKVDDATRPEFIARGMRAWSPFGDERGMQGYYQLPEELLEEPDELRPWVEKAVLVAARKKKKPEARKPEARKSKARKPKARKPEARKPTKRARPVTKPKPRPKK